jgi:hypothetical protein
MAERMTVAAKTSSDGTTTRHQKADDRDRCAPYVHDDTRRL